MAGHDIVVVGTSMGGVDVLTQLVRGLPPSLPASLFVVCHFPSGAQSRLPEILSRSGPLLASHAADGEVFYPGHIYVAPPDRHLLLLPNQRMQLWRGPRENYHRPAIDPLFRSAARHYGRRVIGVVLTGGLDDGTAGLLAVRGSGGIAVVQDPKDAVAASMPQHASQIAGADHVVPAAELAALLAKLIQQPVAPAGGSAMSDAFDRMPDIVNADMDKQMNNQLVGHVSLFSCPECGGALWQVDESQLIGFRCHVGHIYQAETLLAEQDNALEGALWTAMRIFKERMLLSRQLAARERQRGNADSASRYDDQASVAERYVEVLQRLVSGTLPKDEKMTG